MIKEALQYIVGLKEPSIIDLGDDVYSDKDLHVIRPYVPKAERLYLRTLTGLVDYIKANIDQMDEKMVIEVQSPTNVQLYTKLDKNRNREYLIGVDAMVPEFSFGRFLEQESFCISLQAKFEETVDRAKVLNFAGTVENGTIAEYSDDGITQKATVKQGIASKSEAIVPNPVRLKPYRTFLEVEQPESDFIFRMKDVGGVACAIFEADGGAWQMEAMQRIKFYLKNELKGMPQFTVIA